jgi:hypothetical protein
VISFVLFSLYSGNHQKSLGMKPKEALPRKDYFAAQKKGEVLF